MVSPDQSRLMSQCHNDEGDEMVNIQMKMSWKRLEKEGCDLIST